MVDPDPDPRDVLAYALRRDGFDVVVASDGAGALRRWEAEVPDLVLLDVQLLPSAFEVCRRIRAQAGTPLVFLSASADEDLHLRGLAQGATAFLLKPLSFVQLVARIRVLLVAPVPA